MRSQNLFIRLLAHTTRGRGLLSAGRLVRAELAQRRGDRVACERALRTAARLHRENGEEWQATQAEARIGA
jgi:hypothetical protein